MADTENLIEGAFYWVLIAIDPDAKYDWENERMPARYNGNGRWCYLGMKEVSDWPVRWVGERIHRRRILMRKLNEFGKGFWTGWPLGFIVGACIMKLATGFGLI